LKNSIKLFIAGSSGRSRLAIENLERLTRKRPDQEWDIEVIDIVGNPGAAVQYRIMATPCLIRNEPPGHTRLIGDLSDEDSLSLFLDAGPVRAPLQFKKGAPA